MSTSEAAASKISLVTEDPVPASSPKIQVLVIIGDPIVVYPANLQIPWDFAAMHREMPPRAAPSPR